MTQKFNEKCPRCGKIYSGFPSLSRGDNHTEICSSCGQEEALMNWQMSRDDFMTHFKFWKEESK